MYLVGLGALVYTISTPPQSNLDNRKNEKGDSHDEFIQEHLTEDLLLGQLQHGKNGSVTIDTGWGSSYVPKGRAKYGAGFKENLITNSRNMAEYQKARAENAFYGPKPHSINQSSSHIKVRLPAAMSETSAQFIPNLHKNPYFYNEERDYVDREELSEGSPMKPKDNLTSVSQTYANDNISIRFNQARTIESINPYQRRGVFAWLKGGMPTSVNTRANDRKNAFQHTTTQDHAITDRF